MNVKKNQLLLLSSGEYSDYHVMGLYRAVKGFDTVALGLDKHFRSKNYEWGYSDIPKYLVKQGYLVEADYSQWYLGDYHNTINTVLS